MTQQFGTVIPHVLGKPCPFPDATGIVYFADLGRWQIGSPGRLGSWRGGEWLNGNITQYRMLADHHAYGPRVSRQKRKPDGVLNAYADDGDTELTRAVWPDRTVPDAHMAGRIGVWNLYEKKPAPRPAGHHG